MTHCMYWWQPRLRQVSVVRTLYARFTLYGTTHARVLLPANGCWWWYSTRTHINCKMHLTQRTALWLAALSINRDLATCAPNSSCTVVSSLCIKDSYLNASIPNKNQELHREGTTFVVTRLSNKFSIIQKRIGIKLIKVSVIFRLTLTLTLYSSDWSVFILEKTAIVGLCQIYKYLQSKVFRRFLKNVSTFLWWNCHRLVIW